MTAEVMLKSTLLRERGRETGTMIETGTIWEREGERALRDWDNEGRSERASEH